jgi:hypothetical protein
MRVEVTTDSVSGMYTSVTEIPPCMDEACKSRRLRLAELYRRPIDACHGQCEWTEGYEGWGCYE